MTATSTDTPIGGAVATLAARLRGSRRARADLVAEVSDGLHDTAAAYRELGLPAVEAERRSLADFGDLGRVVDELQAELTARHARRTAWLTTLTFPALVLFWDALWAIRDTTGGSPTTDHASPMGLVLSSAIDVIAVLAALTALAGVVALRRAARQPDRASRLAGLAGLVGRTCVAGISLTLAAAAPMAVVGPTGAATVVGLSTEAVMSALSLLVAGFLLWSSVRCVRLARSSSAGASLAT